MDKLQQTRSPRSDKGRVKLTRRDASALTWVGEQYAVRLDHIACLLGREAQRPTQESAIVQPSTAQRVLRRWKAAGLVKDKLILAREPLWVYLTRKGLHELGLPFGEHIPTAALAAHYYWTNQVRLWVETHYPTDTWVSERFLLRERDNHTQQGNHLPDAEIYRSDSDGEVTVIAVEVELTVKSRRRSLAIMHELTQRYDGIWFFTNQTTRAAVERTITLLDEEARHLFRVRDLAVTR